MTGNYMYPFMQKVSLRNLQCKQVKKNLAAVLNSKFHRVDVSVLKFRSEHKTCLDLPPLASSKLRNVGR